MGRRDDMYDKILDVYSSKKRHNPIENQLTYDIADFILRRDREMAEKIREPLNAIYQEMGKDPYGKHEAHWNPKMYHSIEITLSLLDTIIKEGA